MFNQRNSTFSPEIDISLVNQHDLFGQTLKQCGDSATGMPMTCGSVGVGEDDSAAICREGVEINTPLIIKRQAAPRNAIHLTIDRIEAVSDLGHLERPLMTEERLERQCQYLIGTIADEHLFHCDTMFAGQRLAQSQRLGVGVETQMTGGKVT